MVGSVQPLVDWLLALPTWAKLAGVVAASGLATWLVTLFGVHVVRRVVHSTDTQYDVILYEELRLPVFTTVALTGVIAAATHLALADPLARYLHAGALTVVVIVWTRAVLRLADRILVAAGRQSDLVEDFAPIFENLLTFVLLLVAAAAVLGIWNVDVTPILASAGLISVALGFAAKDAIANFFGSVALYFDDTYTVGDYVVLEDGREGTVLDISIRSTELLTREDKVITVPNSVLNSTSIQNESAPRPKTRITLDIAPAFGTDIDYFEAATLEVAEREDLVVDTPAPRMRFREFGDYALDYELRCWVRSPLSDERAEHELLRALYKRYEQDGIDLPSPTREVEFQNRADHDPDTDFHRR